ncbi:MAG: polyprotein [Fushun chilo suppressalis flavivirus 1]|nr:MAG: polyprotein [Fushun chilo suppressalis flavivirus 1]
MVIDGNSLRSDDKSSLSLHGETVNDVNLRFGNIVLRRTGWQSAKVWRRVTDVGVDHIEGPALSVDQISDGDEIVFQHTPDTKVVYDIYKKCVGNKRRNVTLYFPNGHDVNWSQIFGYQDGTSLFHKMTYDGTSPTTNIQMDEHVDRDNYCCKLCSPNFNIVEKIQIHDCDMDNNMKMANALMFLGLDVVMAKVTVEEVSVMTDLDNVNTHNDRVKEIVSAARDGILDQWIKNEYHHGVVNNWNITDYAQKFRNTVNRLFGNHSAPHDSVIVNGDIEITDRDCVGVAELRFGIINRGNVGICDGTLSTNYHNTYGKDIFVMQKGHQISLKAVYQDPVEDVAIFKTSRNYKKPEHGKVYLAIGYQECDKPSVYPMLCAYSSGSTNRALFLPCNLVGNKWEVVEGYSWYGLSGSPIFDLDGEQVGIFGRGFVLNSMQDAKPGVVMSASSLPAQHSVQEKVFSEAARTITNEEPPKGMRGFLVVASTGAGKTMRLTRNLMVLNEGKSIVCLIPTRDSCRAAFNGFCKLHNDEIRKNNWRISLELGEKEGEESVLHMGRGNTQLTFMTYGKFARLTTTRMSSYAHILLDEFHVRNDDIVHVDLLLATMRLPSIQTAMTATDIGFTKWHKPIADVTVQRKYNIIIKNINDVECAQGLKVGAGEESKLGIFKGKAVPREWFEQRTIVFVPTISLCNSVAQYIKSQKDAPHTVVFNSMNRIDITGLPERCVIVATDVIESSVTVPNCMLVIDYQQQNSINRALSIKHRTYLFEAIITPATESSVQQRMGRTGRTCDGIYIKMTDDELSVQSMYPEAVLVNLGADHRYSAVSCPDPDALNAIDAVNTYNSEAQSHYRAVASELRQFKTPEWNIDRWTNLLITYNTECFKQINESYKYDPYASVHKDRDRRLSFLTSMQYVKKVGEAFAKNKERNGWSVSSMAITDPDLHDKSPRMKPSKPTPHFEEAQFNALGMSVTAAASLGVLLALLNKYLEKNSKRNIVCAHTTTKEQFQDAVVQLPVGTMKSTKFSASDCRLLREAVKGIKKALGEKSDNLPEQHPQKEKEYSVSAEERAQMVNALTEDLKDQDIEVDSEFRKMEIEREVERVITAMENERNTKEQELEEEVEVILSNEPCSNISQEEYEERQRLQLLTRVRKNPCDIREAYNLLQAVEPPAGRERNVIEYITMPEISVVNSRLYYKFQDEDPETTSAVACLATQDGMTFKEFDDAWRELVDPNTNVWCEHTLDGPSKIRSENSKFFANTVATAKIASHAPTKAKLVAAAINIIKRAGRIDQNTLMAQLRGIGIDNEAVHKAIGGARNLKTALERQTRHVKVDNDEFVSVVSFTETRFSGVTQVLINAAGSVTETVAEGATFVGETILGINWHEIWEQIMKLAQQAAIFAEKQWANLTLPAAMSGTGLGMVYDTLAKYLTRPVAFAISISLSGFFMYKYLLTPWVCYLISTIMGYFISRLVFNKHNEFRRLMPNCGLELLLSGLIGGGVGHYLVPQFLDPTNMKLLVPATFAVESSAGNLTPFTAESAPTSNAVLLAKCLYTSYNAMLDGDWSTVITNVICGISAVRAGSTATITIATGIAAGLIYVRTMMKRSIDQDRVEKAIAARNIDVINYIDSLIDKDYYKLVDYILPTLCVVTNPLSIAMVVVGFIVEMFNEMVLNDKDVKTKDAMGIFSKCFKKYSGITVIMAGLDVLLSVLKSTMSEDKALGEMQYKGITVPGAQEITGVFNKAKEFATEAEWAKKPAVQSALTVCKDTAEMCRWLVEKFYESAMRAVEQLGQIITGLVEKMGDAFARGIVKSITPGIISNWWYSENKAPLKLTLETQMESNFVDNKQPKIVDEEIANINTEIEVSMIRVKINGKERFVSHRVCLAGTEIRAFIETQEGTICVAGANRYEKKEGAPDVERKTWARSVKKYATKPKVDLFADLEPRNYNGVTRIIDNMLSCWHSMKLKTERDTEGQHLINGESVDLIEQIVDEIRVPVEKTRGVVGVVRPHLEKLSETDFVSNTTIPKTVLRNVGTKAFEHTIRQRGNAIPQRVVQRDPEVWDKARYVNRVIPESNERHVVERNELETIDELTNVIRDAGIITIPNASTGGQVQYIASKYPTTNKRVYYGNKIGPTLLVDEKNETQ